MERNIKIYKSAHELADKFCFDLSEFLNDKFKSVGKRNINIALSGGSTPKLIFDILGKNYADKINWNRINFFWVDERCVPPDDSESNFGMIREHLFRNINIPDENIFRIRGEEDPDKEANEYAKQVLIKVPQKFGIPCFDLILLGMGEDGHTASIFPDQIVLVHSDRFYDVAIHPISKQRRITMTGKILNNAELIFFIVTGENKATTVDRLFNNEKVNYKYPAHHINPINGSVVWYMDESSAMKI